MAATNDGAAARRRAHAAAAAGCAVALLGLLPAGCESTMPEGWSAGALLDRLAAGDVAREQALRPGAAERLLQELKARPLDPGECGGLRLGRGLERELTTSFETRGLWAFAENGTLDRMQVRLAAGASVLVGLQDRPDRIDTRRVALVTGTTGGTVAWVDDEGRRETAVLEAFLRVWRPVGFWMMTVCPVDRVTWDPSLPERAVRARLLDRLGRPTEAVCDFERLVAARPADPVLWADLGGALQRIKRSTEAEAAFRKALALRPDYGRAMNNLAYHLAERGRGGDEAEALARRAVQLEPTNPSVLDTLGYVLLRRGRARLGGRRHRGCPGHDAAGRPARARRRAAARLGVSAPPRRIRLRPRSVSASRQRSHGRSRTGRGTARSAGRGAGPPRPAGRPGCLR